MIKWGYKPVRTKLIESIKQAKYGFEFYISRIGGLLFSASCAIFLGMTSSLHQVAIYGVAQRLFSSGVSISNPVVSSLTPYMNRTKNFTIFYKLLIFVTVVCILGSCVGIVFGKEIITVLFGNELIESKNVLDVFMLSIIVSVVSMFFGYPALMPLGLEKHANRSIILAGAIQCIIFSCLYKLDVEINAVLIAWCYFYCDLFILIYRVNAFLFIGKPWKK